MSNPLNAKDAAALIGGVAGLQLVVSFCYLSLFLLAYNYMTEKGYSFFHVVLVFSIITAFYRAMRLTVLVYAPPDPK